MTAEERRKQIERWKGELLVAIGAGKFDDAVWTMYTTITHEAYNRGVRDGKK